MYVLDCDIYVNGTYLFTPLKQLTTPVFALWPE